MEKFPTTERNQQMYLYWKQHHETMTLINLAKLFPTSDNGTLSRQRVFQILQTEAKREQGLLPKVPGRQPKYANDQQKKEHYRLLRRQRKSTPLLRTGRPHKTTTRNGSYLVEWAPGHPKAWDGRHVFQHILIWERQNGPLPEGYVIHHLNGIKDDNRLENLVALPRGKHHSNLHLKAIQKRICALEEANRVLYSWAEAMNPTAIKRRKECKRKEVAHA